jgi:hypothetical protein
MRKIIISMVLVLIVASCSIANATISWYATESGQTTAINAVTIGSTVGSTVTLDIWYASDLQLSSVTTMFTWDLANSKGTAAVKTETSNLLTGVATVSAPADWPSLTTNVLAGAYAPTASESRGYGNYVSLSKAAGSYADATTGTKLFSVTLTNQSGASYVSRVVSLLSKTPSPITANPGGYDSYGIAKGITQKQYALMTPGALTSYDITVSAPQAPPSVPEPSSMLALGSGVVGLLGFLRRRRS